MSTFTEDLRLAFRALRKNPVLTIVALLSLGIGIGANTAIFSIMDRLLQRSLPVRDPVQIVLLTTPGSLAGSLTAEYWYDEADVFSWSKYQGLRDQSGAVLEGLIARYGCGVSMASRGQTEQAHAELVSGNYFDVLGVQPALGRVLADSDAQKPGENPVAVLSHAYWMSRFGGDPNVLNQSIIVNGHAFTVVGVAQDGFRSVGMGESPAVFLPVTMGPQIMRWEGFNNPHGYWLTVLGRLKPGVSRERAQAALNVVWHRIVTSDVGLLPSDVGAKYRREYVKKKLVLQSGAAGVSSLRKRFGAALYLLMGMVGLLLLIACGNVANLLLARAMSRQKELAIRLALGASRARIVRYLLSESMILSIGGGIAGVLIAPWVGSLVLRLVPTGTPIAGIQAEPDLRTLAFAFAVSVLTGILFGCVPALRASRPDLAPALREQAASDFSSGHARFRKALVVTQIALSVLLLGSAGLFAHSLFNLETLDPGFRADHLLTFSIDPDENGYSSDRSRRLIADVEQSLVALPGVTSATMARVSLVTSSETMDGFFIEGHHSQDQASVTISLNRIGARFFSTMGIPLIAGREFRESDAMKAPLVAIVNETLAKKYFDHRNPIGLHLTSDDGKNPPPIEIVGVVKDSKYDELREDPKPFVYFPAAQDPRPGSMSFYIRTALPPGSMAGSLRRLVQGFDRNLPIDGPKLMKEQIMESVYLERLVAMLAVSFAILASVLAAIGLYGVIAWAVARRKREIGIRMAMGANPASVMRMVLREVLWLGVMGAAIAVPIWAAAGRFIDSQFYGVTSRDPFTIGASILILGMVAGAAGCIPALRAARIDPVSAIRYE